MWLHYYFVFTTYMLLQYSLVCSAEDVTTTTISQENSDSSIDVVKSTTTGYLLYKTSHQHHTNVNETGSNETDVEGLTTDKSSTKKSRRFCSHNSDVLCDGHFCNETIINGKLTDTCLLKSLGKSAHYHNTCQLACVSC